MSFLRLDKYFSRLARDSVPGVVCWIGTRTATFFHEAYGHAQITPRPVSIQRTTCFDLASLTKPLVTAIAIMRLAAQRKLRLEDPLRKFLPGFKNSVNSHITIRQLLTHTSGLPAWFPLYILPQRARMTYCANATTGRHDVVYSCLGYILLGKVIEHITGRDLDALCRNTVFKDHGLTHFRFAPGTTRNIAATEHGDQYEQTWRRNSVIHRSIHGVRQ